MAPINLAIIGLSSYGSWFTRSHLPYILSQPDSYRLVALQNSSKESASKAIAAHNLLSTTKAYGKPQDLASDPEVDLIVVSVKVPQHYSLTKPALEAGKDVFVEWPLARSLSEAEDLVSLAHQKGVKTMVGLQARQDPSIIAAKCLVAEGKVGKVLNSTMKGYGMIGIDVIDPNYEYLLDINTGANILTIPFGHAVDALCWVLGEWEYVSAELANSTKKVLVDYGAEKGKVEREKTSHDQIAVQGRLKDGGGLVSAIYGPGESRTGKGFYWEIVGMKGTIVLEGEKGHVQMFHPKITFTPDGGKEEVVGAETEKQEGQGGHHMYSASGFDHNVGVAWEKFLGRGEGSVTTFEDALVRHRMIDAIYRSAESGKRETYL